MRKANVNDMFDIARLINELNLKEDIFKSQKGEEDLEKIGFNIIFDILAKATTKEAQSKIYECLSKPFEMEANEVGLMEIDNIVTSFMTCFNISVLKNFIKRVNK